MMQLARLTEALQLLTYFVNSERATKKIAQRILIFAQLATPNKKPQTLFNRKPLEWVDLCLLGGMQRRLLYLIPHVQICGGSDRLFCVVSSSFGKRARDTQSVKVALACKFGEWR